MDQCLHIVYPDGKDKYSYKLIPLNTQPLCGLLIKDDTILVVTGYDNNILYFSIEDEYLLYPQQIREYNTDYEVTFITQFDVKC
jgi:hypothetical protein